jgi:hypothetical protein
LFRKSLKYTSFDSTFDADSEYGLGFVKKESFDGENGEIGARFWADSIFFRLLMASKNHVPHAFSKTKYHRYTQLGELYKTYYFISWRLSKSLKWADLCVSTPNNKSTLRKSIVPDCYF